VKGGFVAYFACISNDLRQYSDWSILSLQPTLRMRQIFRRINPTR
jgi:hypothetical protein